MSRSRALAMTLSLVAALVASPPPVLAAKPIAVGDGAAASCTETALKAALLVAKTIGGGTIHFKCGPAPVTISLSGVTEIEGMPVLLIVPNNTTIDGGGLITLDGTLTAIVVFVDQNATGVLTGLTIINGASHFAGSAGGIVNLGTLTIRKSTISSNASGLGGGIGNHGIMTITDSTISGNLGFFVGGGLTNSGTLKISNTVVAGNGTAFDGAGISNFGTLTVDNSSVSNNRGDGSGGGIFNSGTLTLSRSTVSENLTVWGGGILNLGTLKVDDSTLSGNGASVGGGIYNYSGTLKVDDTEFSGNGAFSGGGLFMQPGSSAQFTKSTFVENGAFEGGGIDNFGTLKIKSSTLSGNGAVNGGGIFNGGTLALDGSIIMQNTASIGGGIYTCVEGQTSPESLLLCHGTLSLKATAVTENTPDDIFPF